VELLATERAAVEDTPLARNLRVLRAERNIGSTEAAKAIGISRASLSNMEHGKSEPSMATLEKLAEFYEVDIDWLTGRPVFMEARVTDRPPLHDPFAAEDAIERMIASLEGLSPGQKYRLRNVIHAFLGLPEEAQE
jgi:transcriptional regulator with XRE-family HTH domain